MRQAWLSVWMAPLLVAQTQSTFYAAYQDGLDAERQNQWSAAARAYRRAIELRPASSPQIIIYGNNLLKNYSPHTRLARCLLELGEINEVQIALDRAAYYGEPRAEREALAQAARRRAPARPAQEEAAPPQSTAKEPARQDPPAALPLPVVPPAIPPTSQTPGVRLAPPPSPPMHPAPPPQPSAPKEAMPSPAQAPATASKPAPRATALPSSPVIWSAGLLLLAGILALARRRRRTDQTDVSFRDPEQLGPYRIERLLGRGGFASTYLAHHMGTRTQVALKLLHPYRQDDPEFLRRFRQEAKLGTMLNHPNLVRMLDPGPESGTPWLAMEYVPGRRLDQKLREDGPPTLAQFRTIALQIAKAMAHAHDLGIVHRDLKPGNVILEGDQCKVMDFGISRIVDSSTLTTTYAFLGTPKYAAPEAQLKAQVGPAADRYAFGIMLFEMLAGHPPFDGETPFEILDQHQKSSLPDLRALRPDLAPELVALIESLCRKNPADRPDDSEVIRVLEQLPVSLPAET